MKAAIAQDMGSIWQHLNLIAQTNSPVIVTFMLYVWKVQGKILKCLP